MKSPDFVEWAMAAERTADERFTVLLMLDFLRIVWERENKVPPQPSNWMAKHEEKKRRRMNPAWQPTYKKEEVARGASVLDKVTSLMLDSNDDRPLRDVKAVTFCRNLETLSVNWTELADLTPLTEVKKLRHLTLGTHALLDLSPLGRMTALETLHMRLAEPWLKGLESIATLPHLKSFTFAGNLLLLEKIGHLPHVTSAHFSENITLKMPLRDALQLPDMPKLARLELGPICWLDGIGRYPELVNLRLTGHFRDVENLRPLRRLTHLVLQRETQTYGVLPDRWLRSLEPLAGLPELRWLGVVCDSPLDYAPLADAPKLRDIEPFRCQIEQIELDSLRAVLSPWTEDFDLPEPRPLAPLRFVIGHDGGKGMEGLMEERRATWGENHEMSHSETRWFGKRTHEALDALLGRGWRPPDPPKKKTPAPHAPHSLYGQHEVPTPCVKITRLEDIERLPEIAETLRGVMAGHLLRTRITILVDSLARYEDDEWKIDKDDDDEFDMERERADWWDFRERQRQHKEYIENLQRMEALEDQNITPDPAQFKVGPVRPMPSVPKKSGPPGRDKDEEDDDEADDDDPEVVSWREEDEEEDDGDLKEADPDDEDDPELPEEDRKALQENWDVVPELRLYVFLDQTSLTVVWRDQAEATYLMGREPDFVMPQPEPNQG